MSALLVAVFVASLVGSLHCAGMCGGLVALCTGIDTNHIHQVSRPHRPAPFFHNLVYLLEIRAIANQIGKTGKVWEQNTVNQEAWAIVNNNSF